MANDLTEASITSAIGDTENWVTSDKENWFTFLSENLEVGEKRGLIEGVLPILGIIA